MLTMIVLLLFGLVVFFDYIPVIKEKQKKTIWLYTTLLVLSLVVLVLYSVNIPIPSPSKPIQHFVEKFFNV